MARQTGRVFFQNQLAGIVWQDEEGYGFQYGQDYLDQPDVRPISLTLPLRKEAFQGNMLHPFFDGLIPEGWLLEITVKNWKTNSADRMGLLLAACRDCIGAVSIEKIDETEAL